MTSTTIVPPGAQGAVTFYDTDPHEHPPGQSTMLGFWLYLMSDCLIFAMLFAAYGVYGGSLAGGPGPRELFDLTDDVGVDEVDRLAPAHDHGVAVHRGEVDEGTIDDVTRVILNFGFMETPDVPQALMQPYRRGER